MVEDLGLIPKYSVPDARAGFHGESYSKTVRWRLRGNRGTPKNSQSMK